MCTVNALVCGESRTIVTQSMEATSRDTGRRIPWVPLVLLAAAALLLLRDPDEVRRVVDLIPQLRVGWLAAALLLQALTYLCCGAAYATLAGALHVPLSLAQGTRMAVVNLFVNAAVPSAGLSGNLFLVHMLDRRGVPPGTGAVIVLCERAVYFVALVSFVLIFATRELVRHGGAPAIPFFLVVGTAFAIGVRALLKAPVAVATHVGRAIERTPPFLRKRLPAPERLAEDARRIERAGGASAIRPWRIAAVFALQWGLLVCDALTLWALLASLGVEMTPLRPAIAYGLSTLIAQSVLVPGGLEVSLAGILLAQRIRPAAAIAVTALFHVLSFWAVMPLGGWFYGRATRRPAASTSFPTHDPRSSPDEGPSP